MKLTLAFAAALLLTSVSAAQAQNPHQIISNGGGNSGGGGFSAGGWGGGGSWGSINSAGGHAVGYEEPRHYEVGYATNDGPYVPSTFMKYEDALALGKQMLAEQEEARAGRGPTSVAEAARTYRAVKVPTFQLRTRVLQDNTGKLQICNLNGNDCRRL